MLRIILFTTLLLLPLFAEAEIKPAKFSKFALQDTEGKYVFSRKVFKSMTPDETLLVSFWNTQCLPCRKEIPLLQELQKLNPQLRLLLINLDPRSAKDDVIQFAQQHQFSAQILRDIYQVVGINNGVCEKRPSGTNSCTVPALFVINHQKEVLKRISAFENAGKLYSELSESLPFQLRIPLSNPSAPVSQLHE